MKLALPLLVLLLSAAVTTCSDEASREPADATVPSVDSAEMEPQVAATIEAARAAVTSEPMSAAAWGRLGMVLHAHSLYDSALPAYERAFELAPGDYRWPYLSALARQKDQLDAALEDYRRAAALSPDNPAFYINYAGALELAGRSDEAERLYDGALERDPDSSHALLGLARLALERDTPGASRTLLHKAVQSAPRHGEVHALMAQVSRRLGDEPGARLATLRARAYPDPSRAPDPVVREMEALAVNSRAVTDRGLRLIAAEEFVAAEKAFREVLEIRPGNARDHTNLGGALARQGKLDEAVRAYREALEIDPRFPDAHNNLALALAAQGDREGAREHLEACLAADPAFAQAYLNRGILAARRSDVETARSDLEKAIELDPGLMDAHVELGTLFARGGRLEQAIQSWELGREIDPHHLPTLYNLAVAYLGQGHHGEAIEHLRTALARAPNSSRLAKLLAWELATAPDPALRDGEEALRLARRVHQAYPQDVEAADALAAALAETGRYDEAAAAASAAASVARSGGRAELAAAIEGRLTLYRSGRPYRQPRPPGYRPRLR